MGADAGEQDKTRQSTPGILNILVLRDLERASLQVQAQVLEVGFGGQVGLGICE